MHSPGRSASIAQMESGVGARIRRPSTIVRLRMRLSITWKHSRFSAQSKLGRGSVCEKATSRPSDRRGQRRSRKALGSFPSPPRALDDTPGIVLAVGNRPRSNGWLALSTGGAFIPHIRPKLRRLAGPFDNFAALSCPGQAKN